MSLPACRLTDLATGHQCFPPNAVSSASPNVFINNLNAARVTDPLFPHCCYGCHGTNITGGSPNVFINHLAAARVTSECSCPEVMMTGSQNVFVS